MVDTLSLFRLPLALASIFHQAHSQMPRKFINFPENSIQTPIFLLLLALILKAAAECSKSCSPNHTPYDFPYPFGFSAGCAIRLDCNHDGAATIGEFPVQLINSDHIKVVIKAKCNRRLHTIRQFFSPHYAPTANNAILLQNCSSPISTCLLPTTMVQTKFESPDCSVNRTSISCYTQNNTASAAFLDFKNLTGTNCDYLLSSISAEALNSNTSAGISLEIQTVDLGWWLQGPCRQSCHKDANCTELISPSDGKLSHRCRCREGLVGDGYLTGTGCRKGWFFSPTCDYYYYYYLFVLLRVMILKSKNHDEFRGMVSSYGGINLVDY